MTQLLAVFHEITGNTIETLSAKYGFDPIEAQKVVNHAYAAALTSTTPIDATQAVAQTSGLPTGKPKRVPAAFDLWSRVARTEIRDQLNAALPDGANKAKSGEVTKALRDTWNALPDEAKESFVAETKALRLAAKPPTDPNAKKAKKVKDPNAPKCAKNAFMYYSDDVRDAIKAQLEAGREDPIVKIQMSDVAKVIGAQWRELGADERNSYDLAAVADKARYTMEKAAYNAQKANDNAGAAAPAPETNDDENTQGAMNYDE
jgi:hypothetical protein